MTELVRGPSLARVLEQRGPLPVAEALEYVRQLCEALAYVHAQQVVHRDVKPANVILGERGVVLVDFGIARDLRPAAAARRASIGTPGFMAPEVLAGGAVSPRTDVFGLAATLWTLVVGKPPRFLEPTLLCELADGVDRTVAEAVRAGLEPDPYLRLPSVDAFAGALGEGLERRAAQSTRACSRRSSARPPASSMPPPRRSRCSTAPPGTSCTSTRGARARRRSSACASRSGPASPARCSPPASPRRSRAAARTRASPARSRRARATCPARCSWCRSRRRAAPFGIVQVLRDGAAFGPGDVERGSAFVNLALATLDADAGETLTGS